MTFCISVLSFFNLLLADEINRAPAKVQAALLEVMAERQVTIADESFKLDQPFLVMATQNPVFARLLSHWAINLA
jgi:MoxR-like ATPase